MIKSQLHFRLLISVSLITLLGLSTLAIFVNYTHQKDITEQNQKALTNVLISSDLAIKTLMHSGYADIGTVLHESFKDISEIMDVQVARLDGYKAFENNETIQQVNKILGYERFERHKDESFNQILNLSQQKMSELLQLKTIYQSIDTTEKGERFQTLIYPIPQEATCTRCHGSDSDYRGWIKLRTSLANMDSAIIKSRWISAVIVLVTLMLIIMIVHQYVRRVILPPVLKLSSAISNITGQNQTESINLVSHVEFTRIADIFNLMIEKLATAYSDLTSEKEKLSTLILDAREGIVVTDQLNKVILVNDAACLLLNKSSNKIIEQGIAGLFDEIRCPVDTIVEGDIGDIKPRNIPYRQQILQAQVAQVLTKDGQQVGVAAIFKDVTEETKLKDELNRLARTDGLTGLFNRRHFDETAKTEIARAARYQHPVSLVMFDIDHFKRVNDTYGHDKGDMVIKAVADIGKSITREFDLMCRYGGEEYVILLPNTDLQTAFDFSEALRKKVEAWSFEELHVTISIGIAGSPPNPLTSADDLIKAADEQLYVAKNSGRNQVQCQWEIKQNSTD